MQPTKRTYLQVQCQVSLLMSYLALNELFIEEFKSQVYGLLRDVFAMWELHEIGKYLKQFNLAVFFCSQQAVNLVDPLMTQINPINIEFSISMVLQ